MLCVTFRLDLDEDELLEELEMLEQEELDAKILDGGGGLSEAPVVPKSIPGLLLVLLLFDFKAIAMPPRPTRKVVVEDDEDAELAELKASMAM